MDRRLLGILLLNVACGSEPDLATTEEAATPVWSNTADTITLPRRLFVETAAELSQDHDGDFQIDSLEAQLAQAVVPWVIFSEHEDGLQANEPVTLFQVIPTDCTGLGCPQILKRYFYSGLYRYRVLIRFGFFWAEDTGYMGDEAEGFCGLDSHDGDSQSITINMVSNNGRDWIMERYDVGYIFHYPYYVSKFRDGHPVLYFSAGKHHHFLDTVWDDEDSPYSDSFCNDLVDADGPQFLPNLISPYADGRPNNVGEVANHSSTYFVHDLLPYGFPLYTPWSTAPFLDEDNASPSEQWIHQVPATFTGNFLPAPYARINVHAPGASQVTIYYTKLQNGAVHPWGHVPVDSSGNFSITVPASPNGTQYLFRPAASDYDYFSKYGFDSVPRVVTVMPESTSNLVFDGELIPGSGSVITPPGRWAPPLSEQNAAKKEIAESQALLVAAPPALSALDDPSVTTGTYAATGLPRRKTVTARLHRLLDSDGTGDAAAWEDVFCLYANGPDIGTQCLMGGPVVGASVKFEIVGGSKLIEPGAADASQTVLTNAEGTAAISLVAGTHPGKLRVRVTVLNNPANPFFEPSRVFDVEIHPDLAHEDGDPYHFKAPALKKLLSIEPGRGS